MELNYFQILASPVLFPRVTGVGTQTKVEFRRRELVTVVAL